MQLCTLEDPCFSHTHQEKDWHHHHQAPTQMNSNFFSFLLIMVHILSVTTRPLPPTHALLPPQEGTPAQSPLFYKFTMASVQCGRGVGSSPPSCEHKCYGCSPCEAIQVPTNNGHVGIQYSNYEPEGWKCKCGPTFYSP